MRRFAPLFVLAAVVLSAAPALAKHKSPKPLYDGYCPVAYVEMGKAVKGNPKYSVTQDGHRIQFAGADARKMFEADPSKYKVAFNGECAAAMCMGKHVKADPTIFSVHGGVTYLFSSQQAKQKFDADPDAAMKMMGDKAGDMK